MMEIDHRCSAQGEFASHRKALMTFVRRDDQWARPAAPPEPVPGAPLPGLVSAGTVALRGYLPFASNVMNGPAFAGFKIARNGWNRQQVRTQTPAAEAQVEGTIYNASER